MGDRRLAWLICGFVAGLLAAVLTAPARAQTGDSRPDLMAVALPDAADQQPDDQSGDEAQNEDGVDRVQPVPRIGQRRVVVDGEPDVLSEPPPGNDGAIDLSEPLPPEDGVDPMVIDTREAEDIAAFENPPAGYDPLLFQIEDLDPIRDNRTTQRLFRAEPYDPVGIKVGSFVLFPEVELGFAWYSNLFRAPDARSDTAFEARPAARLASNWGTHALEFRAASTLSAFNEFDSEDDKGYLLETRGRLDVTRRTNVQALLSYEQALESRSAIDASSIGSRVSTTTERAELALNHRFNRLSVQLRSSINDYAFGESQNGAIGIDNSDRDYTAYEQTARMRWEFKPSLSVFGEVAVNQRDYDMAAQSDLINRSSNGQRYRAGVSFGDTGQILRGEISVGYGIQTPDSNLLHAVDGLIIDANATWRASELTSVLFTARSDVLETTTANVGGAFYRMAGIEVRHTFLRHLIGSAGLSYARQDSQDGIIDESEIRAMLGIEYFVNRETILYGTYTHADFNAVGSGSDYTADEVRFGVRWRR